MTLLSQLPYLNECVVTAHMPLVRNMSGLIISGLPTEELEVNPSLGIYIKYVAQSLVISSRLAKFWNSRKEKYSLFSSC